MFACEEGADLKFLKISNFFAEKEKKIENRRTEKKYWTYFGTSSQDMEQRSIITLGISVRERGTPLTTVIWVILTKSEFFNFWKHT